MVVDATRSVPWPASGLRCCCSPGRAGPSLRDAGYRWPPGRRRPRGKRSGWSLVGGHRRILARLGQAQVGTVAPAIEDRQRQRRQEAPGARAAIEQAGHFRAGGAEAAGQADAREERRARRADIRVARPQTMFGGKDVRASLDQLGRRAGSDVLQQLRPLPRLRGIACAASSLPSSNTSALNACCFCRRLRSCSARACSTRPRASW